MVIVLSINRRWHNICILCSPLLQQEQGLSLWQHARLSAATSPVAAAKRIWLCDCRTYTQTQVQHMTKLGSFIKEISLLDWFRPTMNTWHMQLHFQIHTYCLQIHATYTNPCTHPITQHHLTIYVYVYSTINVESMILLLSLDQAMLVEWPYQLPLVC